MNDEKARPQNGPAISERVARGLGWFSIGLGLAELVAPGKLAQALGLEGKETLLRGYGVRELGAGALALRGSEAAAMWSRAGGDLVDLGTLALGYRDGTEEQRRNAAIAIAAVAGITLVDVLTAVSLSRGTSHAYSPGVRVDHGEPAAPVLADVPGEPALEPA